VKTGPVTPISASDRPLPVTDSEAGLASAFQNSVYGAQQQALAQARPQADKPEVQKRETEHSTDSRPGLLTLIVKAVKAVWNYFFG
jgi:hypothetical protein